MSDRIHHPNGRTCPVCGRDKLVSPREAERAFPSYPWGDKSLCDGAELVCSFCKSGYHRFGKDTESGMVYWVRCLSLQARAYNLSQVSSNKDFEDCKETLTEGKASAVNPSDLP